MQSTLICGQTRFDAVLLKRFPLTPDQLRLLASLTFNFIGKAPGMVSVFVILPLVSRSLGTSAYGELLSAIALGSIFTLPFGGINAVGRRLLASAVGSRDRVRQADVFISTTSLSATVSITAALLIFATTRHSWSRPAFVLVSLAPLLISFFNCFDNMRASYNEHYLTAAFQFVSQTIIYGIVFFVGLAQGSVAAAALTLQTPFFLASAATLIVLLIQRPYLLKGRHNVAKGMLIPALGVIMADGALAVLLNLSVYWLKASGNAEMAAWAGTFVRLFQSFLSPMLLILFPLSTYISVRWAAMPPARRLLLNRIFVISGLSYGLIVGCAIAFAGPIYIGHMFKLSKLGSRFDVLALSVFLGAIVAQKTYTMLLYAVSEARLVSYGTAVVAASGVAAGLISRHWLTPMLSVDVLFLFVGSALPIFIIFAHRRYSLMRL